MTLKRWGAALYNTDMRRIHTGLLVGALVVALAATAIVGTGRSCSTTMGWGLETGVYDTETADNGSFVFRGEIGITGSTGRPDVRDVDVVFLAANGSRLGSVSAGDFGVDANRSRNISVALDERPHRIEPRLGQIDAHPDSEWYVVGLDWTGERYDQVTLRSNPESWYC